jgi:hypothetical protein
VRRNARQPTRLELLGELRYDVEATSGGGPLESLRERGLDGVLIAPPLPLGPFNPGRLVVSRIVDRACFLDRPRILDRLIGFRFRRREA